MRWVAVVSGKLSDLPSLENYENEIVEGQRTRLDLLLRSDALSETVNDLREALAARGVPATVTSRGKTISITTQKGAPWLLLIMGALIGLIILAILLVSWQLWKEVAEVVPNTLIIIGVTVIIIIAGIIASYMVQKRFGL